jgi:hypothetical protein
VVAVTATLPSVQEMRKNLRTFAPHVRLKIPADSYQDSSHARKNARDG